MIIANVNVLPGDKLRVRQCTRNLHNMLISWSRMSGETTDSFRKNVLTKSLDVDSARSENRPRAISKHEPF